MTESDRLRMRAQMIDRKADVMGQGEQLVAEGEGLRAEGEALKEQGRSVAGARKTAQGEAKIREGEALIAKAQRMPTDPPVLSEETTASGSGSTGMQRNNRARTASGSDEPTTRPAQ
ncbi:MAG TPA: hypothetical protein VGR35_18190 [Tepidisphaeraceae bacterium]|nr:hypothetical protein [Tepidisphaeraceae bacterium]